MTRKKIEVYANKRGFYFNGNQDYRGFYSASREDGTIVKSDTLQGLKNMIDRNC